GKGGAMNRINGPGGTPMHVKSAGERAPRRSRANIQATAHRSACTMSTTLAGLALLGLAGCSSLMTQSKVSGVTETVFADRVAGGLADYWNTCMVKTTIWPNDTKLDLHGNCPTVDSLPSLTGKMIYAAALLNSPFSLEIPVTLMDIRTTFADFPWPLQNCA